MNYCRTETVIDFDLRDDKGRAIGCIASTAFQPAWGVWLANCIQTRDGKPYGSSRPSTRHATEAAAKAKAAAKAAGCRKRAREQWGKV